jgi:uncharacterized membrane protein affecting hemolysin expression
METRDYPFLLSLFSLFCNLIGLIYSWSSNHRRAQQGQVMVLAAIVVALAGISFHLLLLADAVRLAAHLPR